MGLSAAPSQPKVSPIARYASTILVGVAGAFITVAMPGILLALAQTGHFPAGRAALFASVELGGMVVAILAIGSLLNGKHRRATLAVALATVIAGNIASAFMYRSDAILAVRLLTGIGEGVAVGALGAAAAAFPNPDRLFALFMSTNLGLVAAYLFFLPAIILAGGMESTFVILAALGLLALIALPYFPAVAKQEIARSPTPQRQAFRVFSLSATLGLIGCLGLNTGVGMIWPFMGSLGNARGMSAEAISAALAVGTVAGIAAGFSAAFLGLRFGRRLPLALATLGLVVSGGALISAVINFSVSATLFVFFWTFATSYFMGTVAAAEDGDRAAILIPAAQLGGLALGPQLSAPIIAHLSLSWIVVGGGIVSILSAISALIANAPQRVAQASDRIRET